MVSRVSAIASFKLYESVLRNEREKSFIALRLLSHSILLESLKYQFLADLHLEFNEINLAFEALMDSIFYAEKEMDVYGIIIIIYKIKSIFPEKANILIQKYILYFKDELLYFYLLEDSFFSYSSKSNQKISNNKLLKLSI